MRRGERVEARAETAIIIALAGAGKGPSEIADTLNKGGYTNTGGRPFTRQSIDFRRRKLSDSVHRLIRIRGDVINEFSNGVVLLRMAVDAGDERAARAYQILTDTLEATGGDIMKTMAAVEEYVKGPETEERTAVEVMDERS